MHACEQLCTKCDMHAILFRQSRRNDSGSPFDVSEAAESVADIVAGRAGRKEEGE